MEQGTHFLDLMRHFGGEVQQETLQGIAVGPELKLRDMPEAPEGEHSVRGKDASAITTLLVDVKESLWAQVCVRRLRHSFFLEAAGHRLRTRALEAIARSRAASDEEGVEYSVPSG